MDNGLIFPYRRNNVRAGARDAKHARLSAAFRGGGLVESVIRVCSRQAAEGRRKVAHPQCWLSEAKCGRVGCR